MYSLLFIDLGKAKRSEVYHILLTVLSFGRDSFVSFRPASEIHHPPTDKKNYIYPGGFCCTRRAQLLLMAHNGCIFIQLLLLVLTCNLFCLDSALISGLWLDPSLEPSLRQWWDFFAIKSTQICKLSVMCLVHQWLCMAVDKGWDTIFQKSTSPGVGGGRERGERGTVFHHYLLNITREDSKPAHEFGYTRRVQVKYSILSPIL